MTSHFNAIIDRHNTGSVKWDFIDRYLQLDGSELLPMWVSDFDFPCPPEVQRGTASAGGPRRLWLQRTRRRLL